MSYDIPAINPEQSKWKILQLMGKGCVFLCLELWTGNGRNEWRYARGMGGAEKLIQTKKCTTTFLETIGCRDRVSFRGDCIS